MDSTTWKSDFEAKKPPVDKAVNTIRAIFMQSCLFLSLLTMIPKTVKQHLRNGASRTGSEGEIFLRGCPDNLKMLFLQAEMNEKKPLLCKYPL